MSFELGERTISQDITDFRLKRSGSSGRTNSGSSSIRVHRFSLSTAIHPQEDLESHIVSGTCDIGDRARGSMSHSHNSSVRFSFEHVSENGGAEDTNVQAEVKNQEGDEPRKRCWPLFEDISLLVHLAVFGILGVFTRYLLQKLFGPGIIGVTSDQTILYLDLPSNMVGSFLMGWLGVVFKDDISKLSNQLLIGLTTGYLGSLTTFSGWNQAMLNLSVTGHWVFTALGFLVSMLLCAMCIIFGVHLAESFKSILRRLKTGSTNGFWFYSDWKVDDYKYQLIVFPALIIVWVVLVVLSGVLEEREFKNGGSEAQLWLACLVAPLGVWIRRWLSRLNGKGLGPHGSWKWFPFGTLIANVSAACIMAALATIKEKVNTQKCITVASGIQLGFLGCLSTVSTFIAEYRQLMLNNDHRWRADAYAAITIIMSFALGTLIYSVPVWVK